MRKSLISLVLLLSLTACSDRTRTNCERTKNKALTSTVTNPTGTGRCA